MKESMAFNCCFYTLKIPGIILWLLLAAPQLEAQSISGLSLVGALAKSNHFQDQIHQIKQPSLGILPTSVLANPKNRVAQINPDPGYLSFLCRQELIIEEKLPIGIWLQIGEQDPMLRQHKRAGAVSYLQFKLLKF